MKTFPSHVPAVATTEGLIRSGSARSITRLALPPEGGSLLRIFDWACKLSEEAVHERMVELRAHFSTRRETMEASWAGHHAKISAHSDGDLFISDERKLYIGSLFSKEFSFECTALRNPCLCLHPDQSGLPTGSIRFLLAMDALGKDLTSSMIFREGVIDGDYAIHLSPAAGQPCAPEPVTNPSMRRSMIFRHLHELGFDNAWTRNLMQSLGDEFTRSDLLAAIETAAGPTRADSPDSKISIECLRWLAEVNYELTFDPGSNLSDRVLLPTGPSGKGGLHQGRFTRSVDQGNVTYLATCMACHSYRDLPLLLESTDLVHFSVTLLGGAASRGKGMVLFPGKIKGRHAALCGRGNESIYIMFSENPAVWEIATLLKKPVEPWEALGITVCGAPMETYAGWLVLYHGRGEMDREAIGAMLLDRDDPGKVLGHLKQPLIEAPAPGGNRAPSCSLQSYGALIHRERLLVTYTTDEAEIVISQFDLGALLDVLQRE